MCLLHLLPGFAGGGAQVAAQKRGGLLHQFCHAVGNTADGEVGVEGGAQGDEVHEGTQVGLEQHPPVEAVGNNVSCHVGVKFGQGGPGLMGGIFGTQSLYHALSNSARAAQV